MSLGLSASDFSALSSACGVLTETLARRLALVRVSEFKAGELKLIIKYLRTHPAFAANPYNSKQITGPLSQAKKQQQADALKNILDYQLSTHGGTTAPGGAAGGQQPAAAAAAAAAAMNAAQLQQQAYQRSMQAVQQQQQQQRTYAAPNPHDPYGRYSQAASVAASSRPLPTANGYPQQQSYQQIPQHQQQFAYTNGNGAGGPRDYTQYARSMQQQQQHLQPQQHHLPQQPQYHQQQQQQQQMGAYAPAYAAAASSVPSSRAPSHPALNAAARTHEINSLCALPAMNLHRSPYERVEETLAKNLLDQLSGSNMTNVGGSGSIHTQLHFNLTSLQMQRLKRAGRRVPEGQTELEVHLRLFCALPPAPAHWPWDKKFRVLVNGSEVPIPEPKKLSKMKKKGLELVRGLDISEFVAMQNTVEVSYYRGSTSYTVEAWRGLVIADLISMRDTSELMEIQEKIKKEQESKKQATALQRQCIICHSTKDPLRCSRCKSEWYCTADHQRQHWPTHRERCVAPTPAQDLERENVERKAAQMAMLGPNGRTRLVMPVRVKGEADGADSDLEEGVEEVDSLVSLKCPLSLERYVFPARGKNCGHLPCFNLETFLQFSQQSGVWQCPLCYKALPWEDLEVDLNMLSVIRETHDSDVSQIRVHPDGQYDVISNVPDGESGDGREPRKRKQPSASPTNAATTTQQPPAQRQAMGAGATPTSSSSPAGNWAAAGAVDSSFLIDPAAAAAAAAASPQTVVPGGAPISHAAASPAPSPYVLPSSSPAAAAATSAGTADEPIELD